MATVEERFWVKVDKTDKCWVWTGALRGGYGLFWIDGGHDGAHRVAYELTIGLIPEGLVIDHLCRNRACVNPAHLEPVTPHENFIRGISPAAINARKTHCPRGHEFTPENTYTHRQRKSRQCVACSKLTSQARNKTDRGPGATRTHCPSGHEYDEANTYQTAKSGRRCRKCAADRSRRNYYANKAAS